MNHIITDLRKCEYLQTKVNNWIMSVNYTVNPILPGKISNILEDKKDISRINKIYIKKKIKSFTFIRSSFNIKIL